ncbi:TonB-dependent receptor domain-containing protein [Pelagerythrobacter marensis]|uniref:TonB-dependent receptor domain-containing protein n=1 Tax=Pelagerythrobacter marensis TaxID=543877 RepID=UPI001F229009|nr:TonB-dependent receptor [Pelagerythrobacter marensis]
MARESVAFRMLQNGDMRGQSLTLRPIWICDTRKGGASLSPARRACGVHPRSQQNMKPASSGGSKGDRDLMKNSTILKASAAPIALGLALSSAPAFAQDSEAGAQAQTGQTIVVTGSRIQNPNLENASPVAVVTSEELGLQQANTPEESLRQIPGLVPSVGSNVNNGNGGATYVNLRGLGENRNLVLLNGTRLVPQGLNGLTNIDVIPVALLERMDVLTGGAGAAYGADAISGVVNFVTKSDFEGVDLSLSNQITEEGDGHTFRADLLVGGNFADGRGNAVFAVGYTNRDAVFQGDRPYGVNNISSFSGNAGGSSTAVPSVITVPGTTSGTLQVQGDSLVPFYEPFNFNPYNVYQTPLKQYRLYGAARYEVSDAIEVFTEGMFVQSTTSTIIAPSGTFRNVLDTPLSNPFMGDGIRNQICGFDTDGDAPGTQRLFSQAECDAAATATDPNDPNYRTVGLDYGRRFVEFGPRLNDYRTRLFQVKAGARGPQTDTLDWEVFGAYGESENVSRQSGNGTLTRLQQAVLATDPNECLDTSNGCVPIDLFGPLGSLTPAVRDFLDVGNSGTEGAELSQVQAFIAGDLGFGISSEPISIALGGEYRDYYAFSRSDLLSQTPGEVLGNGAAAPDTEGSYDVKEVFGELIVPLARGTAFADELTLELGGRISDYSTTGTEYTWKVGGTWSPIPSFQVRGGYQSVTRAPNIEELFDVPTTGLDNFGTDPCSGSAPVNDANLRAICLAQGAPVNSIGNIQVDPAGQVNVTTGGNPDLDAENAKTWTLGAVFQPDFIRNFTMTVDYYNITLEDAITEPNIGDVFAACFDNNPSPNNPACTAIRRNPATGNLFGSVATTPGLPLNLTNQGRLFTDGIDLTMNWSTDLGFAGLDLGFAGNWTNRSEFKANQDDPQGLNRDCVGLYSINCSSIQPEFSFTQRTTLRFDDFDLSLRWRYIDGVQYEPIQLANDFAAAEAENRDDNGVLLPVADQGCPDYEGADPGGCVPNPEFRSISAEHYFDLTAVWRAADNFSFTAGIINLFNNKPKVVGSNIGSTAYNSGNVYPSTYDPLGRRFSVTARLTF